MGSCASKFKVLKSAADAPPPEEVASRDLDLAEEELVKKYVKTPLPADDAPKRRMLGHLLKESEGDAGATENNGKESEEVEKEDKLKDKPQENENVISAQCVTDAPAKGADHGLGNKASQEEKKAGEVEPARQNAETEALSEKATEEKLVESAKLEAEKPDEIIETVGKGQPNEEVEVACSEEPVDEQTEIEKGTGGKHEAEIVKEVEVLEAKEKEQKPAFLTEKEMMKEQAEATEVEMPEMEDHAGKMPGSDEDKKEGAQGELVEMTMLQVLEEKKAVSQQKPYAEVEEKKAEEKLEPMEKYVPEKKPEMQVTEEQAKEEKPALDTEKKTEDDGLPPPGTTMNETEAEKKTEADEPLAPGLTKIETDAEKKIEDDQPLLPGATEIETDAEKKTEADEPLAPGLTKIETDAEKKPEDDQPPHPGITEIETDAEKKTEDDQTPPPDTTEIETDAEKETEDDQTPPPDTAEIETDAGKETADDQTPPPGTTKIEPEAEKKAKCDQPAAGGTTLKKEEEEEEQQQQAVEDPKTEQPGEGHKPEEKFESSS